MDKKILLQELSEGVARRKGLTKRDAETFVRTVFEVIEHHLKEDKMVKIKGLGTFKLVSVESRESVNVNTGERIQIKGHTKISFTPDAVLRDQINKPFAEFETVILHKDTDIEEMERVEVTLAADEMEVLSEENAVVADEIVQEEAIEVPVVEPIPEEPTEEAQTPDEVKEESAMDAAESEAQVPEETEAPEDTPQEVPEEPEASQEEIVTEEVKENPEEVLPEQEDGTLNQEEPEKQIEKASSGIRFSKKGLFGVIVLILLLMAGCYFIGYYKWLGACLPESSKNVSPKKVVSVKKPHQQPAVIDTLVTDSLQGDSLTKDSLKADSIASPDSTAKVPVQEENISNLAAQYDQVPDGKYLIVGTQGTHVVADGQTLRIIALAVYGSKGYASYIITHNRIENPDAIEPGMKLNLPKLTLRPK